MSIRTAFSVCAWGFLVSFPIPGVLHAATRTDTFGVTVLVQDTCVASLNRSTTQSGPNQGALLSGAPPVSVTCRNLTRYDVTLSMEPPPGPSGSAAAPALSAPMALPRGKADKHRAFAGAANELSQPPAGDARSSPQRAAPAPNADTITVTVTY